MSKVYIPNDKGYDLSAAEHFGEPVIITEGMVNIFHIRDLRAMIKEKMKDAQEDDHVAMIGAPVINALVTCYMMLRFGKVNLLIFNAKDAKYEPRLITEIDLEM